MMKITLAATLLTFTFFGSNGVGISQAVQHGVNTVASETFTLYPPHDKATGKYDETRACFSFKLGRNKLPNSTDWDLGYGFARIGDEDWLIVGTSTPDKRSVMMPLGEYKWSDSFKIPALEPLPELKQGERRQITVDSSADTHQQWVKTTSHFAKARAGHIYLMHVKDNQADFYVLFRIEELEQADHCTISWKRIPAPEKESFPTSTTITRSEELKSGRLLARKVENGVDNYPYAVFSFEFGGNGPEVEKLCRNDWDIIFGNSPLPDAFDVTTVTDDRSRIRDLGRLGWEDKFEIPRLSAYEEPERESSVKAVEGHIYLVHTRDTNSDLFALFRVEKLELGKSVEISWKVIAPPKRRL
jgi:hypothetical protein